MECMHCHRELKHDWNFCPDCGGLLDEASTTLPDQTQERFPFADDDNYPMGFDPALYSL